MEVCRISESELLELMSFLTAHFRQTKPHLPRVHQFVPATIQAIDDSILNRNDYEPWAGLSLINSYLEIKELVLECIVQLGEHFLQKRWATQDNQFKDYAAVASCCDDFLKMGLYLKDDQLVATYLDGYFCGHRLCPVCQNYNLYTIKKYISRGLRTYQCATDLSFYFITLCLPDAQFDELGKKIDEILMCWTKFSRGPDLKKKVGYFRSTAVEPVSIDRGESFDRSRYRVHIHCVLALRTDSVDDGTIDRLTDCWRRITKQMGTLDIRLIDNFSSYINRELGHDSDAVHQILDRTQEFDGVNRAIAYLLKQNNPFRDGVDPEKMKKYMAIKMRYPRKRWNYTRGGLFRTIKIKTFKPKQKRLKYPPEIIDPECLALREMVGEGCFRAMVNDDYMVASPNRRLVGEFYYMSIAI